MITKIELINFKCYEKRSFDISNLTIFCGNNSVGKSTAIQALAVPFQSNFVEKVLLNGELVSLGTISDVLSHHSKSSTLRISLEFDIKKKFKCTWGFDDENEQSLLRNHLNKKSHETESQLLSDNYFKNNRFQFLQAERFGPRSYLENSHNESISSWLGSKGEYVYEVITEIDKSGLRLDNNDKRLLKKDEGPSVRRNIINWMSEISPGFNFESDTVSEAGISHAQFQAYGSKKTTPPNMGFGLSYSLSIVCALLITKPGGLVVIENPEAHLHPRGQSYLGRLIARAALAGVQVIIETHSDHLLNGIRVAARLENDYEEGLFKVYFVSGEYNKESTAEEINIGTKGELSMWPKGFFDQQAIDVKTLMKGVEI